jgi:hypothetical protein
VERTSRRALEPELEKRAIKSIYLETRHVLRPYAARGERRS